MQPIIDIKFATTTGWDANRVKAVAQEANNKLTELGYEAQNCLVDLGETLKVFRFRHASTRKTSTAS